MKNAAEQFEKFMKERQKVAQAYVSGDSSPLARISAHRSPASFFGPGGGYTQGADKVLSTNEHGATQFESGSTSDLEIFHMEASDSIAYWVGLQHAKVRMHGKKEAIAMDLRVTEIFRFEEDAWKLIHRHADMLAAEKRG